MPTSVDGAASNELNPNIGRVTRFAPRWSCSTLLFEYLTLRMAIAVPCPLLSLLMAASLAALPRQHLQEENVAMTGWRKWMVAVAGIALAGWVAGSPSAAAGEDERPNAGRVSLNLGADWASAYYFRGIVNVQNGGSNVQPYAEIGFKLLENVGPLTSLTFAPGIWNNFQYGEEGRLVEPSDPRFWFESDPYLKLSATWGDVLTTGVTYTYYTSPNDSFATNADVGLNFSLNDAQWLGAFALNPSLLFAFETKGEALVSDTAEKGIYLGIGLAPGYTVYEDASLSFNVSAPLTFGFSLKDYYTVNGKDQTFGYFSGGPLFTVGLKFIPAAFGTWALKAGVQFLVLNSNLQTVNTGDSFVPIGSVGVAMTY
jgi:hypothetical protein